MASNHFDSSPGAFASQTNNHRQTRSSSSDLSASGSHNTQLRAEFQPSEYSVVCGRGSYNHIGNSRFRILAGQFMERYSQADTKAAKTDIVSEIIAVIRQAGGNFYRYKKGAWFELGYHYAREKVSALLRDLLHTQYRSSAEAKKGRRRKTIKQKQQLKPQSGHELIDGTEDSDDSSITSSCWGRSIFSMGSEHSLEDDFFEIHSDDFSTTSSCWGRSKDSLGFEYWLEDSDDFFDIDVF
jgi:hypothetical protein